MRRRFTVKTDPKNDSGVLYQTAAVLGVGLIGGSLSLAFKRSALVGSVIGVSSARTIEKALEMGVNSEAMLKLLTVDQGKIGKATK